MVQKTRNYIFQYKALFYISWICLYFIFPAWISLHLILQAKGLSYLGAPVVRSLAILGLIIYFYIAAYLINRYFSALVLDKPVIINIDDWLKTIKHHVWLVIFCCLAVVLHVHSFFLVELGYLHQGLWMYDFSNKYWHRLFDLPVQYGFWSFIVLSVIMIKQKKIINSIANQVTELISIYHSNNLVKYLLIFCLFVLFSTYSNLFPYSREASLQLLRFPPVSRYLYLITYYAFGVSHIAPRIVQLIFYILSAVYIYRTVYMFREKEIALLGATIYLFSPVIFHYASYSSLASGTVFFMILISFHFLRFIKDEDNRDLILTSYFIGIGFMYKRVLLVMFIICFAYLVLSKIKKRDWHSFIHYKILLLSLLSVLPFFLIGRSGFNFYAPKLSNLISFNYLFLVIQSQLSIVMSFLFLGSIIYILFRRDDVSMFFGFYFITYYIFFVLASAPAAQRYIMAVYPAIAFLSAQFIFSFTQQLRYVHAFKLTFSILTVYLIFLCLVPRYSSDLISFKYKDFESQQYPIEQATEWIRNRTNNDDKILFLSMPAYFKFYIERFYPDKDKINPKRFVYYARVMVKDLIYPLQKLKEFCYAEDISYIMFPFGPKNTVPDFGALNESKYLEASGDDELIEAARFNQTDNYIIVYELKENSVQLKEEMNPEYYISGI